MKSELLNKRKSNLVFSVQTSTFPIEVQVCSLQLQLLMTRARFLKYVLN